MEDIFLARQPIYNRQLNLVGYELLYRANDESRANFSDAAHASSRLITNTFMGFGLESIVGSSPAFINLTLDFFINDKPIPMNREQVVLEISEALLPEPHALEGLEELAAQGYTIALDDFVYKPELEPLMNLASIIKIDLAAMGREGMAQQVEICRQFDVKLAAEKVETTEDLEYCKSLGFDYFQGYFLCKPQLVRTTHQPPNRAVVLRLLEKLRDEDAGMEELEKIVIQDMALTYKLLRYLNCASYAQRREINSVREALMLIGAAQIKKWAILLLMSSVEDEGRQVVLTSAMVRARMCELLAKKCRQPLPADQAFTTGLLSTLDAVLDTPAEELLDELTLSVPIKLALQGYEGELGSLLKQALFYERGERSGLEANGLSMADYAMAYLGAIQWAKENTGSLLAETDTSLAS